MNRSARATENLGTGGSSGIVLLDAVAGHDDRPRQRDKGHILLQPVSAGSRWKRQSNDQRRNDDDRRRLLDGPEAESLSARRTRALAESVGLTRRRGAFGFFGLSTDLFLTDHGRAGSLDFPERRLCASGKRTHHAGRRLRLSGFERYAAVHLRQSCRRGRAFVSALRRK